MSRQIKMIDIWRKYNLISPYLTSIDSSRTEGHFQTFTEYSLTSNDRERSVISPRGKQRTFVLEATWSYLDILVNAFSQQ